MIDKQAETIQLIDSCKKQYNRAQELAFYHFGKKVAAEVYGNTIPVENFAIMSKFIAMIHNSSLL